MVDRSRAKVGDYLMLSLPNGTNGYAQYLYRHKEYTSLIQVFDLFTDPEITPDLRTLRSATQLFPPVFVAFDHAIREGQWRILGSAAVQDFRFPSFRCTRSLTHGLEPGVFDDWLLWDGHSYRALGILEEQYRPLEYLVVWAPVLLADRIVTGRNFPFALML
jgi:hypothetical protein